MNRHPLLAPTAADSSESATARSLDSNGWTRPTAGELLAILSLGAATVSVDTNGWARPTASNENDLDNTDEMPDLIDVPVDHGIPTQILDKMPVQTWIGLPDRPEMDCVICLDTAKRGDTIRPLPCGHAFHQQCVDNWLQTNSTCPYCRQDAIQDPELARELEEYRQQQRQEREQHLGEQEQWVPLLSPNAGYEAFRNEVEEYLNQIIGGSLGLNPTVASSLNYHRDDDVAAGQADENTTEESSLEFRVHQIPQWPGYDWAVEAERQLNNL